MKTGFVAIVCCLMTALILYGCTKDDAGTNPSAGSGLTASPASIAVQVGSQATATVSGGRPPYDIHTAPNAALATAVIAGSTLTVDGIAAGSTSVVVRDSSGANSVAVPITVSSGGGGVYGSGTISASSPTQGNVGLSGVGVWPAGAGPSVLAVYDTTEGVLGILGYEHVSGNAYNVVMLRLLLPENIPTGAYPIGDSADVSLAFSADTTQSLDSVSFGSTAGSITITSATASNVNGTFSITADRLVPPTSAAFTGTFAVTYVLGRFPWESGGQPGIDSSRYYVYGGSVYIADTAGYHPERNGYTQLGSGTATAWYSGAYDYYIVVTYDWNTVRVDAVQGSSGQYFGTGTTGNTLDYQNISGPPDGAFALLGGWYPGSGGYVLINAVGSGLTSVRVVVVPK